MFYKFLSLPNDRIRVRVKGKRVNRGAGYGLYLDMLHIYFITMRKLFNGQRKH